MDVRLRPLNGLLALLRPDGAWFHNLADQGFRLHSIELPVQGSGGLVRADAVIYRQDPDLIVLCECKSGRNLDEEQARRYAAATYTALRRGAALPSVFRGQVAVNTMYVVLDDYRAEIEVCLQTWGIDAPVLSIGSGFVRLDGDMPDGLASFVERDPSKRWPPARIRVDHQSPINEIMELLAQRIASAQARRQQVLDLQEVAKAIYPAWDVLSPTGRRDLTRRLVEAGEAFAKGALRGAIFVERGNEVAPRITILRTPADADPRGMPQAWQGQARRLAEDLGRGSAPVPEETRQLSLDDLYLGDDGEADLSEG